MKIAGSLLRRAGAPAALALLVGAVYAIFFYRPPPPPAPTLPSPNGYDDLVRAAGLVNLPQNGIGSLDAYDLRVQVEKNREALDVARRALARECRVPLEYTERFARDLGKAHDVINALQPLFEAEAVLAEKEERFSTAIGSYLDCVVMGVKGFKGGLVFHRYLGDHRAFEALRQLRRLAASLGVHGCRQAVRGLEVAVADEEPIEEVLERDKAWWKTWSPWSVKVYCRVRYGDVSPMIVWHLRTNAARLRLVLADLAIRAHQFDKGSPPESLLDLIPNYLIALPEDPFSGRPLVYRREGKSYLLYSVGPDGRDNGGLVVKPKDLKVEGDYFLESGF